MLPRAIPNAVNLLRVQKIYMMKAKKEAAAAATATTALDGRKKKRFIKKCNFGPGKIEEVAKKRKSFPDVAVDRSTDIRIGESFNCVFNFKRAAVFR